jgi:two-component system chemotaxis response regulator CheB
MSVIRTGKAAHYVCHVGHSWSPHSFLASNDDGIEQAMWTAISAMQEKATMLREMAGDAARSGDSAAEQAHHADAGRVDRDTGILREQLMRIRSAGAPR